MLESLRSFVGGWIAKILLVLLVGSFALWGISGSIFGTSYSNSVAQVGETHVSIRDFVTAYNRNMNDMQRQAGRRLTRDEAKIFGVENRTLSNVVSYAVLDEFARRQNLSLSDTTLAKMLAENPQFQDSTGKFNRDTFTRAVRDARMRESDFITLQNASAVRSQVTESFATGNILPKVFANAMTSYSSEERKFSHITITKKIAGTPAEPASGQLKTWFDANTKKYRAPEYRKIDLLILEPKDIVDERSVTDEDVAEDYEVHKRAYEIPEKRRVQQIVFKSRKEADAAVESLAQGAVFETILADNKLAVSDADLGLLVKDKLPKALQEAAFIAKLNTPSAMIKGPIWSNHDAGYGDYRSKDNAAQ